jgi:acetamidase/formamidase
VRLWPHGRPPSRARGRARGRERGGGRRRERAAQLPEEGRLEGTTLAGLAYPLLGTQDEWVLHGFSYANYLAELGADAQKLIYEKSSVDLVLRDAFRKTPHFLVTTQDPSEDEAISPMTVAVDFGITRVVDGNWGVHAVLKKSIFAGEAA